MLNYRHSNLVNIIVDPGLTLNKYPTQADANYSRTLILNSGCTLESLGDLWKILMPDSHPRDYDLIGLGYGLGVKSFKISPDDSNVQPRLGISVVEPYWEELLCLKETKQKNT